MNIFGAVINGAREAGRIIQSRDAVSNPSKVASGDIISGDISILQLAIRKGDASFDIMNQVTEIHIFESIVSPVIYCHMTFADAINLEDDFKINKSSLIRFEFQTPGADESSEYVFRVNRLSGKRDVPGLTMKVFDVEMISVEGLAAQNNSMEGFKLNDTSGNLIEKVIKDYIDKDIEVIEANLVKKYATRLTIDKGYGIISKNKQQVSVLGQNRKPFETIHELALLTNKSPKGHSLYTFFERKDGYYFRSIEELIEDGKKVLRNDASTRVFFYDSLRNQALAAVKFRNILAYNIVSKENLAKGRAAGVNTQAVTSNPETGVTSPPTKAQIEKNDTDLISMQALRSFDTTTRFENITSSEFSHLNEVLVKRRQILLTIAQQEAQIMVYGDTDLTAGDVIECNFPRSISTSRENSDPERSSELSPDSGYYLITHLRHMILNTDRPQHIISCNLMRAEPLRR